MVPSSSMSILGAGLFLQGADVLAAGADDGANFIRGDLDGGNARVCGFNSGRGAGMTSRILPG